MSKKKTHEEYVIELAIKNSNIEVIGKYIDSKTPILHKCKIDGYKWFARPAKIMHGQGCPMCSGNVRKTTKEYANELAIKNPTIEVVGEYRGANKKIMHHCLIHDIYWEATPTRMLGGSGCEECKKEKIRLANKKTHEQYVNEVKIINPNIIVLGEYVNAETPILHKCLIHNIEWMAFPVSVLRGGGCYECGIEKSSSIRRKSHEQYVAEVMEINSDIEVVGIYVGSNIPILHKCKIDGYEWYAIPSNILFGYGCPQCNESSGERQIRQWLESNNIKYIYQMPFIDCHDILPLPFDFYLPNYNIAIEYQGEQHYRPVKYFGGEEKFELQQKHDDIKKKYCANNNIKLLEIPYWENVEETLNNFLFI